LLKNNKELKKLKRGSKEFTKELMKIEKSRMSIQRFKGLGEMNPEELWNTTSGSSNKKFITSAILKRYKKRSRV
jgi:DNA gyrase subunit B